ncbi:hypothetical protein GGR56DRAFT_485341 [Xylariaceae sp. FL0804]|nr:hypothetical protein GGR56DRAFT_485341 [Xylariaceae sp. FL0804]
MLVPKQTFALLLAAGTRATVVVQDPSDVISPADWAADNKLEADYNVPQPTVQPTDLVGTYEINGSNGTSKVFSHETLTANGNDTSVVVIANGADVEMSHVDILKEGYSSNLNWASFYGFNAAINVANASTAELEHLNITVHNGAAGVYAYGDDTVVNITESWMYSSGPVSHGLYASGNGTIHGSNLAYYSGGKRSSAFSGDMPAGYIYVSDSVAHTAGVGSATFYALGWIIADNVVSISEQGPVVFMDSDQVANLTNCQGTAGLLGGVAIFSSAGRTSGAQLNLKDSSLNATGDTMPGLWFGNTIIDVTLDNSKLITASGILISANTSSITQDFNSYAGYDVNSAMEPAEVYATVSESNLEGDLVAYNKSVISMSLQSYTSWVGSAYSGFGDAYFDIALDKTSNWTLTNTTTVQNLTDAETTLSNIHSGGYTLYYNSSALLSSWLNGSTIALAGGGSAEPIT